MDKTIDSKRKSRNLSEKKRRDQFNNLINELNNLIDPHFNNLNDDEDDFNSANGLAAANAAKNARLRQINTVGYSSGRQLNLEPQKDSYQQVKPAGLDVKIGTAKQRTNKSAKVSSSASSVAGSLSKQRKMDKSSVLKCAMEFLKKHSNSQQQQAEAERQQQIDSRTEYHDCDGNPLDTAPWKPAYITDDEFSVQMLEALDAFIVVCEVNPEARIIYSSDTLTNLLNYTGTCNSLRHHDYVSLFDLIASFDRPQIEKLFAEQPASSPQEDSKNEYQFNLIKNDLVNMFSCQSSQASRISSNSAQGEYISLAVNFCNGLNLTEIKQRRQQQKQSGFGGELKKRGSIQSMNNDEDPSSKLLISERAIAEQQDIYMHVVDHEANGGRSQQSIAEQQQHLLSECRAEQMMMQQDHHQQQQQQRRQQQQQQSSPTHIVHPEMMQIQSKLDEQQLSDGSNELAINSSDDTNRRSSSSGVNSDENSDQPSGTGSDDASDSNQSQNFTPPERRHHYRHHTYHKEANYHHHNHHKSSHNHRIDTASSLVHQRRPKKLASLATTRQQYELVRLMATFRSLDNGSMPNDNINRYKFEEPPPIDGTNKRRYFICIGRLDVPRLSYDLKIIVPPMRGGSNIFHNNQFLSKHTLKWRFLWVDNRAPAIIGYLPFEVLGTSGYDYYHWDDLDKLVISHEGLMRDGQAHSGPYRFLTKGQQWIWLQTKYCIIFKPQYYAEQRRKQQQLQVQREQQEQQQQQQLVDLDCQSQLIEDGPIESSYSSHADYGHQTYYPTTAFEQQESLNYGLPATDYQDKYSCDGMNYEIINNISSQQQLINQQLSSPDYTNNLMGSTYTKKFDSDQANFNRNSSLWSSALEQQKANLAPEESIKTGNHFPGERRLAESELKPADSIKRQCVQPINSGSSSRNFDHYKFILCTHTVIGFDESDGYVNSNAPSVHHRQQQYSFDQVDEPSSRGNQHHQKQYKVDCN